MKKLLLLTALSVTSLVNAGELTEGEKVSNLIRKEFGYAPKKEVKQTKAQKKARLQLRYARQGELYLNDAHVRDVFEFASCVYEDDYVKQVDFINKKLTSYLKRTYGY